MIITIPNERPLSWNVFYAGKHHSVRTNEKNRIRIAVREQIDPETAVIFDRRVDIITTVYFDKNPYDPDNIPNKFYIDALCGWFIKDDTRKYIRMAATISEIDRNNPRTEIEIIEVNQ